MLRSTICGVLLCALSALAAQAAPSAAGKAGAKPAASTSVSGVYKATVEIKGMAAQPGQPAPALGFSGKLLGAGDKFRLELNNSATQEQQIYIMDGAGKHAWMLFPDTLNGISSDLASFDHDGVLQHAQQFASGNNATPKSWGKAASAAETLNGQAVTHLTYTLPAHADGTRSTGKMHIWQSADTTPLRIVYDSALMKVTVDFSSFKRGVKLDSSLFTPDKKYKIRPLAAGEAPPLPGGFGGGGAPVKTHGSHS